MVISIFLLIFIPFSIGENLIQNLTCSSTELNYEGQNLRTISNIFFKNCTSINLLNLQDNKIVFVKDGAFRSLSNLTHIDLSYNNIKQLPSKIFTDTPNLREVNFSRNNITFLPTKLFHNLPHLEHVNFQFNDINKIEDYCFVNVPSLEVINLRMNELQSLELKIIDNYSNIKEIKLYGNKWNCDITKNFKFCEFMHMFVSNFWEDIIFMTPMCHSPKEIIGISWKRLTELNVPIFYSNVQDDPRAKPVSVQCALCKKTPISWEFKHQTKSDSLLDVHNEPAGPGQNITSKAVSHFGKYYTHSELIIHDFSDSDVGNYTCYTGSTNNFWNNNNGFIYSYTTRFSYLPGFSSDDSSNIRRDYTPSISYSYDSGSGSKVGYYIAAVIAGIIGICCRIFRFVICTSDSNSDSNSEERFRMA